MSEAAPDARERAVPGALILLLVATVLVLWVAPLGRSFWLDECETYWLAKDGAAHVLPRLRSIQLPTSAAFALLESLVASAGGREVALRLPSLLALGAATLVVARIGARLLDREAGLMAAVFLACDAPVATMASDARPYALALLATAACVLALLRWLERGRAADGVACALLAGLAVHLHLLQALALPVLALLALLRRREGVPTARATALVIAGGALLAVGAAAGIAGARYPQWAGPPSGRELARALVPLALVGPAVAALAGAAALGRAGAGAGLIGAGEGRARSRATLAVLFTWHALPLVALYGVCVITGREAFVPRYALGGAPGLALLLAALVRRIDAAGARVGVAAVVVALALGTQAGRSRDVEDFRAASGAVRELPGASTLPVVFGGTFAHGRDVAWWHGDPVRTDFLLAPFAAYPVPGPRRVLPEASARATPEGRAAWEELARELEASGRFVLVDRTAFGSSLGDVAARFGAPAWRARLVLGSRGLGVVLFERVSAGSAAPR